jgi:hypothetical protein
LFDGRNTRNPQDVHTDVNILEKVKPRRRILVKMLPVTEDYYNPHGLILQDKKKHWNHEFRRGVIVRMDDDVAWHIPEVHVGDTVVFNGAAGFTLDGDIMDDEDKYDEPLKGEGFRWLKWKELEAVQVKTHSYLVDSFKCYDCGVLKSEVEDEIKSPECPAKFMEKTNA